MTSRVGIAVAALLAAVALSAVAVGSASADWFINGTKLVGSAELATTAKVDTDLTLRVAAPGGGGVKVLCTGSLDSSEPLIDSTNAFSIKTLTFLGCSTIEPATKCALQGQPTSISTAPLVGTMTKGPGNSVRSIIKALTKGTIATLAFSEADTCAFTEEEPVTGSVTSDATLGQNEEVAQAFEALGTTENNSLLVAGDHAYVEGGRVLLRLLSGSKWSFR
jgi:hypothetical protein